MNKKPAKLSKAAQRALNAVKESRKRMDSYSADEKAKLEAAARKSVERGAS